MKKQRYEPRDKKVIIRAVILFLLTCQPLYAADLLCDKNAKEGEWKSVEPFNRGKGKPVKNVLLASAIGAKTIAFKLDQLPVNASKQDVIEAIGEAPTQNIFSSSPGLGKMTWTFESMGKMHGASVYFYGHCISEISIQSFSPEDLKGSHAMLVKKNKIPDK